MGPGLVFFGAPLILKGISALLAPDAPPSNKDKNPAPKCETTLELNDPEVAGLEEVELVRWIDGDTVKLPADLCRAHGVKERHITQSRKKEGDQPGCSGRLLRINTTEKVATARHRQEKEKGALEGWEYMEEMAKGQKIWLKIGPEEAGYGRLAVEQMYIQRTVVGPKGEANIIYVDMYREALRSGWAHVYVYAPDPGNVLPTYLPCQWEAQNQKKGLWQFPEYQGAFNMTSIHANGRNTDRFPKGTIYCGNDTPEHPNCEYFRITNTTQQPVNLKDYKAVRYVAGLLGGSKQEAAFPDCVVPSGISVQVFSGKGENQVDTAKKDLVVFLQQETEFWPNDGACAIITGPDGKTETFRPTLKKAECPSPDYRK